MQVRGEGPRVAAAPRSCIPESPVSGRHLWRRPLIADSSNFSDEEPRPLPEDHYRPMRLGLLLGDTSSHEVHHRRANYYTSLSSLASSEANNTSPLSTLTSSSDVAKRDDSAESVTSLLTASTSSSPDGTKFRRHGSLCPSDNYVPLTVNAQSEIEFVHEAIPLSKVSLKPLHFEVPNVESYPIFLGRHWVFKELDTVINSSNHKGVCILGGAGTGKSSILLQFLDNSPLSRQNHEYQELDSIISEEPIYQSVASLGHELVKSLGSQLVAYHFCQSANAPTCLVPDFVHSLAAQLMQSSQLTLYRDLLLHDPSYLKALSIESCVRDSSLAFIKGILDPLRKIRKNSNLFIIIDALNEAELHKPDYGDTLGSFLAQHLVLLPSWMKVVVTIRSSYKELVKGLSLEKIDLDNGSGNDQLHHDLTSYILHRINTSTPIQANITPSGSKFESASPYAKFTNHLANLSKGSMLYIKSTLDLIEKGFLVVKSASFRVLPVNLSEVYQLMFNLKFTTTQAYERVRPILQVCLATLVPLTMTEIFYTVNSGQVKEGQSWDNFLSSMNLLTSSHIVVVRRHDGTVMFPHPSLREWLLRREEGQSTKFLCDVRTGHAHIALHMTRWEFPLAPDRLLELGHHVLKAHVYKTMGRDIACAQPRDLQALWVHQSTSDMSPALTPLRNIHSPNVKVSRLLLLAGASPDVITDEFEGASLLIAATSLGHAEMVGLLLEFGANVNMFDNRGMTALCIGSSKGHMDIVRHLLAWGARINQTDHNGECALVLAARGGSLHLVSLLVQWDWPLEGPRLQDVVQQALIVAAGCGHEQICQFFLDMVEVRENAVDPRSGYTALTSACSNGQARICEALLSRGALVNVMDGRGEWPLGCAAHEGQWKIVEMMLSRRSVLEQRDREGRTPLMLASIGGHLGVLELLLSNGAQLDATDFEGLAAISWASYKGHTKVVHCLLNHGAVVNHSDRHGRIPLDLAAMSGSPETVKLLLDNRALLEHVDLSGIRPLDRAINSRHLAVVALLLQYGATLGAHTWTAAEGKQDVIYLLLKKLGEDGMVLYKKNRVKDATHRFIYGLKKFTNGEEAHLLQLKYHFFINLARCKRKLEDQEGAIEAADQAIQLQPKGFEGYFQRARACKDTGRCEEALKDVLEALTLVSPSSEVHRGLSRLKEDILIETKPETVI